MGDNSKTKPSDMYKYFIIYKPFGMLSQFKNDEGKPVLGDLYHFPKDVYPVGRLDMDSEGLLILTNDKRINNKLLDPKNAHQRAYWVQVDGDINSKATKQLEKGVIIRIHKKNYKTLPANANLITGSPDIEERNPPIRYRKSIPTSWFHLVLTEGKNRQVRKMTAQVGFSTLRLIRNRIEKLSLDRMKSGDVKELKSNEVYTALFRK